uniref:Uncharacterized AAA domain-containing protein ycf46 n=2 Tax=viral metagenome TaxID=1070528 RepID=A0A6M3JQZ7_9ZZZZ
MKGKQDVINAVKAGYQFIYAQADEVDPTVKLLVESIKENNNGYEVSLWNYEFQNEKGESEMSDPEDVLKMLENIEDGFDSVKPRTVVIAKNWNWFLVDQYGEFDKAKVSWLQNRAEKFASKEYRKVLIIVSNTDYEKAIPAILKKDFVHITFDLPDEEEIEVIYNYIVRSAMENPKFINPDDAEKAKIIGSAKGLTKSGIEKAFSFSLVKDKGKFSADTVAELRAAEIASTKGLTLQKYDDKIKDLIGFEHIIEHMDDWNDDPDAKGIIILGPAGTGKSTVCRALANHYKRTIIELEFAQLMGEGLVGQAENAMANALRVVKANANPKAPIILYVDEIEKGLAGSSGAGGAGGSNDGGTTDRSNAQFLKFMGNPRPGIIVLASCNDIEKLPAAYIRADRWDCAPFAVDLPNRVEAMKILDLYKVKFNLPKNAAPKVDMKDWSGAEIKTWAKLAAKKISKGKNMNEADMMVVAVAKTAEKEISYLRKWVVGRTVPASKRLEVKEAKSKGRGIDI